MSSQPSCRSAAHLGARLLALDAVVAALEMAVDAAFERGDPLADGLDGELAATREYLAEIDAEYADYEDGRDLEESEYHEGVSVEEQLISAYARYLKRDPRGPFAGEPAHVLTYMRGILEEGAGRPIAASDPEILEAARDTYAAELARRGLRWCARVSNASTQCRRTV